MMSFSHLGSKGLQHPSSGSHLASQGTAPPYEVAPQKPEYKQEEDE